MDNSGNFLPALLVSPFQESKISALAATKLVMSTNTYENMKNFHYMQCTLHS